MRGQTMTMAANEPTPGVRTDGPHPAPSADVLGPELSESGYSTASDADPAGESANLPLQTIDNSLPDENHNIPLASVSANQPPPVAIPIPAPPAIVVNSAAHGQNLPPLASNPAAVVSPASASLPVGVTAPEALLSPLEERIRRLETELAALKDTKQLESRVAARVSDQLAQELAPGSAVTGGLGEIGKRLLGVMQPTTPWSFSPRPPGKRTGWLFLELFAEARVIVRMYLDPRYRMTWVGRVVPITMLILFLLARYLVASVPIIGPIMVDVWLVGILLVNVVQLIVAYILFKVLAQEARRYRETSPDIPASLRL
jgi:hypothetical protein